MEHTVDTKRVLIFIALAFGMAWATALIITLTGGIFDSPALFPDVPQLAQFTLATALMATGMMWSPGLAHILTRLITREPFRDTTFRPYFDHGAWKYWLLAWLLPPVLVALGGALYFLIIPQHFDPTMSTFLEAQQAALAQMGQTVPDDVLRMGALINLASALIIAPIINSFFTFGEEFGWRGYLQPKLMPLGGRRAMLLMGLIWGLWHWPVIFMGYEYGLEYPGAPFAGPLLFLLFTTSLGTIIGWLALRGRSVWPAVLAHAMINGFAAAPVLFLRGEPNPLLGPLTIGIIGMVPMILFAVWLFLSPQALAHPVSPAIDTADDIEELAPAI